MRLLARISGGLLTLLALIGALAVLTLMLHVASDVILRNTVNTPIPATYEIATNYYMVAMAFIPLAWVEKGGGMVRVEALEGVLNPTMLRISDFFVALLSTVIYLALAWFTFASAMKSFSAGTFVMTQSLAVPTWPAYFLPPLGFALAGTVTLNRMFGASAGKAR